MLAMETAVAPLAAEAVVAALGRQDQLPQMLAESADMAMAVAERQAP